MSGNAIISAAPPGLALVADLHSKTDSTIEAVLQNAGLLTDEAAARVQMAVHESGERFDVVMTRLGLISEAVLQKTLAQATGLLLATLADFPKAPIGADTLSAAFLRDNRVVPIAFEDSSILSIPSSVNHWALFLPVRSWQNWRGQVMSMRPLIRFMVP
jgi:hypothetical protein